MKLLIDMNLAPRWVEFLTRMSFQTADQLRDGALVTIDLQRTRLRLLPLNPNA